MRSRIGASGARCNSSAHATASDARANAATKLSPSPCSTGRTPPQAATTSETVCSKRATAAVISSGWVSHSRVEPSTSAKSNVAVPVGKSPLTPRSPQFTSAVWIDLAHRSQRAATRAENISGNAVHAFRRAGGTPVAAPSDQGELGGGRRAAGRTRMNAFVRPVPCRAAAVSPAPDSGAPRPTHDPTPPTQLGWEPAPVSVVQQYADAVAETSYAKCDDLSLAYQVFGDGPVELVFVGSTVSHVELFWTMPDFKAFFDQLATFCRVLAFDKAGVGLSDPVPQVRTLDDRAAEIEAVMDAVGFGKAVLFGMSEGGPASIVFAATRPRRTQALILYGTFSYSPSGGWDDVDRDPA